MQIRLCASLPSRQLARPGFEPSSQAYGGKAHAVVLRIGAIAPGLNSES